MKNKNIISRAWKKLGHTGQLILCLTLFFFVAKSLGRR